LLICNYWLCHLGRGDSFIFGVPTMDVLKQFGQPQTELGIATVRRHPSILPWVKFTLAVGVVACTFTLNTVARAVSFTGLGALDGAYFYSDTGKISADGSTVSGSSVNPGAKTQEAFRWTQVNGMQGLGFLSHGSEKANLGEAWGLSADGSTIVGYNAYGFGANGYEAFRWTEGTGIVGLGTLDGSKSSAAYDVSHDGTTVVGVLFGGRQEAFRWTPAAGLVGLGFLSDKNYTYSSAQAISADGRVITGESGKRDDKGNITESEAFRWLQTSNTMEALGRLPGDRYSNAFGISADGSTIVGFSSTDLSQTAFRWTPTTGMQNLGITGINSLAWDVSDDGDTIVGLAGSGKGAVIWRSGLEMTPLQDILIAAGVDLNGWTLESATGISGDGRKVVGFGINPDGNREAWLADLKGLPETVPTPALLPGLLAIAYKTHRKRKHQAIA
jgi:probable HAF family extracellular repeat protein